MSETTNYGLYVESGNTARFAEWRKKMNGEEDSNMVKIDAALSKKADRAVSLSGVLMAGGWTGTKAPYVQTLEFPEIRADHDGLISLSNDIDSDARCAAMDATLCVESQDVGALTIAAHGILPALDIPVVITLFG